MKRVHDIILECLIKRVQKLKKLIDNQNAGASDRCQEEGKKHIYSETLRGHFG
jgi:hypothetical protein